MGLEARGTARGGTGSTVKLMSQRPFTDSEVDCSNVADSRMDLAVGSGLGMNMASCSGSRMDVWVGSGSVAGGGSNSWSMAGIDSGSMAGLGFVVGFKTEAFPVVVGLSRQGRSLQKGQGDTGGSEDQSRAGGKEKPGGAEGVAQTYGPWQACALLLGLWQKLFL